MTRSAVTALMLGSFLVLSGASASAAGPSPAALLSKFRLKHGEVRVRLDPTLDRIALAQAKAMASRDVLSHNVLGSFASRIAPTRARLAAENIAYGYDNFPRTLQQWINSPEHRRNLLLRHATRVGIASAKDASGRRTYWVMEIAGDYERKHPKPSGRTRLLVARRKAVRRRETVAVAPASCHVKLLSLCL
jgi:hypothetical protein